MDIQGTLVNRSPQKNNTIIQVNKIENNNDKTFTREDPTKFLELSNHSKKVKFLGFLSLILFITFIISGILTFIMVITKNNKNYNAPMIIFTGITLVSGTITGFITIYLMQRRINQASRINEI